MTEEVSSQNLKTSADLMLKLHELLQSLPEDLKSRYGDVIKATMTRISRSSSEPEHDIVHDISEFEQEFGFNVTRDHVIFNDNYAIVKTAKNVAVFISPNKISKLTFKNFKVYERFLLRKTMTLKELVEALRQLYNINLALKNDKDTLAKIQTIVIDLHSAISANSSDSEQEIQPPKRKLQLDLS